MSYENIKIRSSDQEVARSIRSETGLAIMDVLGVALDGFRHIPQRVRGQLIQERRASAPMPGRPRKNRKSPGIRPFCMT